MAKKRPVRPTAAEPTPAFSGIQRKSAPTASEFNPDYSSVRRELRRIGTLAGIFLAILVVLSFFQDQIMALVIR